MHKDASFLRDSRNLPDWLNGADFVVGMHYGDKERARLQGPADIIGIDTSKAINSQVRYLCTEPFQEPTWIYYRRMLPLGSNYMRIRPSICEEYPFERVIVGFTSTASEYDFVSIAAQQPGNLRSSFLDRLSRRFSGPVAARWIAVWFFQHSPHCRDHFRGNRGACVEIEVDASSF
jgi:hypothetical protein